MYSIGSCRNWVSIEFHDCSFLLYSGDKKIKEPRLEVLLFYEFDSSTNQF